MYPSITIYPSTTIYPSASTTFDNLITDRSASDITEYQEIKSAIESGEATVTQIAKWNSFGLKGAYNYTDLNRVGTALNEIKTMANQRGISITYADTPKTDFAISTAITLSTMTAIKSYCEAVKTALGITITLPTTMQYMNYEVANNIEKILYEAYQYIQNASASDRYSGDLISGEQ